MGVRIGSRMEALEEMPAGWLYISFDQHNAVAAKAHAAGHSLASPPESQVEVLTLIDDTGSLAQFYTRRSDTTARLLLETVEWQRGRTVLTRRDLTTGEVASQNVKSDPTLSYIISITAGYRDRSERSHRYPSDSKGVMSRSMYGSFREVLEHGGITLEERMITLVDESRGSAVVWRRSRFSAATGTAAVEPRCTDEIRLR